MFGFSQSKSKESGTDLSASGFDRDDGLEPAYTPKDPVPQLDPHDPAQTGTSTQSPDAIEPSAAVVDLAQGAGDQIDQQAAAGLGLTQPQPGGASKVPPPQTPSPQAAQPTGPAASLGGLQLTPPTPPASAPLSPPTPATGPTHAQPAEPSGSTPPTHAVLGGADGAAAPPSGPATRAIQAGGSSLFDDPQAVLGGVPSTPQARQMSPTHPGRSAAPVSAGNGPSDPVPQPQGPFGPSAQAAAPRPAQPKSAPSQTNRPPASAPNSTPAPAAQHAPQQTPVPSPAKPQGKAVAAQKAQRPEGPAQPKAAETRKTRSSGTLPQAIKPPAAKPQAAQPQPVQPATPAGPAKAAAPAAQPSRPRQAGPESAGTAAPSPAPRGKPKTMPSVKRASTASGPDPSPPASQPVAAQQSTGQQKSAPTPVAPPGTQAPRASKAPMRVASSAAARRADGPAPGATPQPARSVQKQSAPMRAAPAQPSAPKAPAQPPQQPPRSQTVASEAKPIEPPATPAVPAVPESVIRQADPETSLPPIPSPDTDTQETQDGLADLAKAMSMDPGQTEPSPGGEALDPILSDSDPSMAEQDAFSIFGDPDLIPVEGEAEAAAASAQAEPPPAADPAPAPSPTAPPPLEPTSEGAVPLPDAPVSPEPGSTPVAAAPRPGAPSKPFFNADAALADTLPDQSPFGAPAPSPFPPLPGGVRPSVSPEQGPQGQPIVAGTTANQQRSEGAAIDLDDGLEAERQTTPDVPPAAIQPQPEPAPRPLPSSPSPQSEGGSGSESLEIRQALPPEPDPDPRDARAEDSEAVAAPMASVQERRRGLAVGTRLTWMIVLAVVFVALWVGVDRFMAQKVTVLRPSVEAVTRIDASIPALRAGLAALDAALANPALVKAEDARIDIVAALVHVSEDASLARLDGLSDQARDLSDRVSTLSGTFATARETAERLTPAAGPGPADRLETLGTAFETRLASLPSYAADVSSAGLRLIAMERRIGPNAGQSLEASLRTYEQREQAFRVALDRSGLPLVDRQALASAADNHKRILSVLVESQETAALAAQVARTEGQVLLEDSSGLLSNMDAVIAPPKQALAQAQEQRMLVSGATGGGLLLLYLIFAFMLKRSVTKPLGDLGQAVRGLSLNDDGAPLPGRLRDDDIGVIARGVEDLRYAVSEQVAAAKNKFEAATAYLTAVLDSAPDPVIHVNETGVVVSFNPASETLFGHRAANVIGRSVGILMPPEDRSDSPETMAWFRESDAQEAGNPVRQVRGVRADGAVFPAELTLAELRRPQGGVLFILFLRDLTEELRRIKETDTAKRATDRSARAHGEFLNVLGTEMAQPVAAMNAALDAPKPDLAKVEHGLAVLNAITTDVRGYADLESGLFDLDFQPVPLQEVCEGAINANLEMAQDFDLKLALAIRPGTPPSVMGDQNLLQGVLRNMTECMLQFVGLDPVMHAANPGTISIAVRSVKRADGHRGLRFEIGSEPARMNKRSLANGRGKIPRSPAAKLRMDVGGQRGRTGMLLVIAKRLATLQNGDIGMESWPGRGTVLWFEMDA